MGRLIIDTPEAAALARFVRGEPIGSALGSCGREELRRLAVSHLVLAPLAERIGAEEGIEPRWRRWSALVSLAARNDALRCERGRARTIGILLSRGISAITIKGPSLSFGQPRDEGDVDLLIPAESLEEAISALESEGYSYCGFDRNFFIKPSENRDWKRLSRWSVQYEFIEPRSGTLVEIHIALFDTARIYDLDMSRLRAAVPEFAAASVMDPATGLRFLSLEDRALLLAVHAWIKRSPSNLGFVLRHILDLKALSANGLDWERTVDRAFRYKIAPHLLLLLRLSGSIAGFRPPAGIVERIEAGIPRRVAALVGLHLNCMVTLTRTSREYRFAYRFLSPFVLRGTTRARVRALLVIPLLVPRTYELATAYGLPRRTRWAFLLYAVEPLRLALRLARKARSTLAAF
jgi:hypothetical protein